MDEALAAAESLRGRGIGLCLSGGGFRATLFHAGVIQRLTELGVTNRPDFDSVAAVSGGAIAAAYWAAGRNEEIRPFTSHDIRTGPLARKYLLPWNWFRGAHAVDSILHRFERTFGPTRLNQLPDRPRFIFCGTDMTFGASFIFERDRVGSYQAGYAPPEDFTLAQAVAASACFPPLFGPMRIDRAHERFKGGRPKGLTATQRQAALTDLRITDGGVYDNMALEPVWKDHATVLVSDAGGPMDSEPDKNWFWRMKRYQAIQETQARAVRKRFLIAGYAQQTIQGAYIGIGSATARYTGAVHPGYSKAFAMEVLANIRTDLDAFSEAEQSILINHGYSLIDAAIRTHVSALIAADPAPFAWPHPAFAPGALSEPDLRQRLAGSEKRKLKGRS